MNPFDFIPPQYKIAAIALALVLASLALFAYGHRQYTKGVTAGKAQVQAKWDAQTVKQQETAIAEAATNAKETQRRLERQGEAQRAQDEQLAQAQHDAASATDAAGRLLQRANQLAASARRASSNPAAGGDGKTADATTGMLADVLGKAVERSRLLAAYADAARRAGQQCARDYDSLSAVVH